MEKFNLKRALALVTEKDVDLMMTVDAPLVASQQDEYRLANKAGYYLASNTWALLIKEFSPYGWLHFVRRLQKRGLIGTIREFDRFGDAIVHGEPVRDTLASLIQHDVETFLDREPYRYGDKSIGRDPMATVLFLFRFLKRFSPLKADLLEKQSITDFKENERKMKLYQRKYIKEHKWYTPGQRIPYWTEDLVYSGPDPASPFSEYIIRKVRDKVCSLNWEHVLRRWNNTIPQDWMFTPGVTFECNSTLLSKLNVLSRQYPEYFVPPFGIPYIGCRAEDCPVRLPDGTEVKVVRVMAVPKSYKAARIVAPEETIRQMKARLMFSIIEDILPADIQLRDQSQNANASKEGSLTGNLSTLDLSRASDCNTPTLMHGIFPKDVRKILDELTASYWVDGRNLRVLQQYSTMGNSLTFVIESIVFWAICQAAVDFHYQFCPEEQRECFSSIPGDVSVYGDDCIVPTSCALECIEWLECCGFTVNIDKSFYSTSHLYRESCGEEWYNGIECSSSYWPRKEISATIDRGRIRFSAKQVREGYPTSTLRDSMESIISLQHRLIPVSQDASYFLVCAVLDAHPRMTFSEIGSDIGDLWGAEAAPLLAWAPMDPRVKRDLDLYTAPDYLVRNCHYVKSNVVSARTKLTDRDRRILNNYRYQDFLRNGPVYLSELDKLLGISAPRISDKDASGEFNAVWSLKKF